MRRCSSSKDYISSAARFFGSIRLNSASMRADSFGSSAIAWRTAAAISVMTSCENDASAGEGAFGSPSGLAVTS